MRDTMTPEEAADHVIEAKRLLQAIRNRLSVYRMHPVFTSHDPLDGTAAGRLDAYIDAAVSAIEPLHHHLTTHAAKDPAK